MRTRFLLITPILCLATLTFGCSDDTTAVDDANETTAASGSDTTAAETESGTNETAENTDTADDPTESSTDEGNFISEEGPDTTADTDGEGNLGEMCETDEDCADDLFCNGVVGLAAVCSECGSDDDCEEGNCTFTGAYFGCGDGSLGQMCETDEACGDGLFCAEVVNLGGLFNDNFCSECKEDSDCSDGQLCAPQLEFMDIMNFSGQRTCIDPNTSPNSQVCDADGAGDEQCEGFCTSADIMGFLEIGVCGDCETDVDCGMDGTCTPAMVGLEGFAGSSCG